MTEKNVEKSVSKEIPFETLVKYAMNDLPKDEMKRIESHAKKEPHAGIVRGIKKTAKNHSLKTVNEVVEWLNVEAQELGSLLDEVIKADGGNLHTHEIEIPGKFKTR